MYCHKHLKKSTLLLLSFFVFIYAKSVINGEMCSDNIHINKTRTFTEGDGVLLPCNVTESPDVKVWWTKNVSRSDFHQDGIVLRFNAVSRLHGGTYLCHTQNVNADVDATVVDFVILNVQYPAEAPEFNISKNRLWEDEILTIYADVEGNPDPTYAVFNNDTGRGWLRANHSANFSINVKVRCEDMGNFMVTGYNKLNKKNFTKSEYVTVLCPPKPDVYKNNKDTVYAALGANTSLRIDCFGYPYPKFLWRHDKKDVTNRSSQLSHHASAIFFESTSVSDFGNYILTVTNEYGYFSTLYQLIARGAPGKPTNLKVLKVNEHSVVLGWKTGYDYGLPQTVHVMKWIGNESIKTTLVYIQPNTTGFVQKEISHLDSNTTYRIVLVSENTYGLSKVSDDISFVTKGISKDVNKKRTFREGDGVLLPCNVTESPDVKVWWTKNVSRSVFHQDGIVLGFKAVSRLDGGTYLCHAQNVSADASATVVDYVILNVQYPAEAPEFFISRNRLWENEILTIYADVEGNPDPTYAVFNNDTGRGWLRANHSANFSINVKVRCEDMGNFMVTGYNKLNKKNFTKSEYVTVLCPPKPDVYKNNKDTVYAALGAKTSLRIDCFGYPYPRFQWRHGKRDITYRSSQLSHHASVIFFESTSVSDFGNYILNVTNEYGYFSILYQLIARGPPGKPTNLKVLKVNEHSVVLSWKTGYDYGLPQTVHVVKWIGNESMSTTLVYIQPHNTGYVQKEVSHLDSNTTYRIVLVSENIYGLSKVSDDISFVTKEEAQSREHSGSNELSIIIPVSILGALCLIAVLFAIVHLRRNTLKQKVGSSSIHIEKKYIIN